MRNRRWPCHAETTQPTAWFIFLKFRKPATTTTTTTKHTHEFCSLQRLIGMLISVYIFVQSVSPCAAYFVRTRFIHLVCSHGRWPALFDHNRLLFIGLCNVSLEWFKCVRLRIYILSYKIHLNRLVSSLRLWLILIHADFRANLIISRVCIYFVSFRSAFFFISVVSVLFHSILVCVLDLDIFIVFLCSHAHTSTFVARKKSVVYVSLRPRRTLWYFGFGQDLFYF